MARIEVWIVEIPRTHTTTHAIHVFNDHKEAVAFVRGLPPSIQQVAEMWDMMSTK